MHVFTVRSLKYFRPAALFATPKALLEHTLYIPVPGLQKIKLLDLLSFALPLLALVLWSLSLQHEDVRRMNDLGMISTFPPLIFVSLAILMLSFCIQLQRTLFTERILFLHLALLIFMLFGIQNIVEEAPRFAVVYRHAGYTEYIMRTGGVNPSLDAYFSWPGFFVLSALLTQLAGYHDILSYAGWAPVFYNLIYLAPLYVIFSSATNDKRLLWLAIWFFAITNWIGQDYFSPQGFNFFLYLVIIAIVLKWLQPSRSHEPGKWGAYLLRLSQARPYTQKFYLWMTAPFGTERTESAVQSPRQRLALLAILLVVFAFVAFSHPLTPFFVLASVIVLALFRRCSPRWLPIVLTLMTALWIIFMTRSFLMGHSSMVLGNVGQVGGAVATNVTARVHGNLEHTIIAALRIIMTATVWLLALCGALRRLRMGHKDSVIILLALTPFPLIVTQQYGGEMFLRIYLFSLPFMTFLAAGLFFPTPAPALLQSRRWLKLAVVAANVLLLTGFLFTRYGNERTDYMTYQEVAGVQQLYHLAPSGSLLLSVWDDTAWQSQDYEKYTCRSLADQLPQAVATQNVAALTQYINQQAYLHTYLIITRGQKAQASALADLPPGTLDSFVTKLAHSKNFALVYQNTDVQIFTYTTTTTTTGSN